MSRTFDVLERIQQDRDLFRVPPIAKAMPSGIGAPRSSLPDVASFAREEILRLIQHLFLAAENVNGTRRRQVVFCGIDNNDGSNLLCARIGRILAEQVQSQVCVVDANVGSPHPVRWSICFRLTTRQIRMVALPKGRRGASPRIFGSLPATRHAEPVRPWAMSKPG